MTATFNLVKSEIITEALRDINVVAATATPTNDQYNFASNKLNIMIKKWEGIAGVNLWKRRLAYLFPQLSVNTYTLGTSGDNCTNSYEETTLSSGGGNGDTTIVVVSSDSISDGDYIGIKLDNGTRFWTTVSGSPAGTTVTLTDALTSSASSGATVIAYTAKINRPLQITRGTVKDLSNNSEVKINFDLSYDEYFDFPLKNSVGRPNQAYYDKLIQGNTPYTGTLYLYPTPNNVDQIIIFSYQEPLSDMINSTDYPDFPQQWLSPLISNLRCELCPRYGKFAELQSLQPIAETEFQLLKSFDNDDSSLSFGF